jgi:hypothetical protein
VSGLSLAVDVAGVLAAVRQRPHRWVCHRGRTDITLAGSHCRDPQRSYPRLGSKPVPAPRTRYEVRDMSPSGSHRRDRLKHPLPSASKCVRGGVCGRVIEASSWGLILSSWFLGVPSFWVCIVLSWCVQFLVLGILGGRRGEREGGATALPPLRTVL